MSTPDDTLILDTSKGRVVIRSREHLAALLAEGDALLLNLLRFKHELRPAEDYNFPSSDLKVAADLSSQIR